MKRLCTICARGGSKGVGKKNIRLMLDKPLIAHTILQAKESNAFDVIAVSSDSNEILSIAKTWGVDLLVQRPKELALDSSPKIPVIRHTLLKAEKFYNCIFDYVVDLDVTSPLREISDIKSTIEILKKSKITNVITATPSRRSPYFNLVELTKEGKVTLSKSLEKPVYRRQDCPKTFDLNASIYGWSRETLIYSDSIFNDGTEIYIMPEERSIDIDSEFDFAIVEFLMKRRDVFNGNNL